MKTKLTKSFFLSRKGLIEIIMKTFLLLFSTVVFSLTPNDILSQNVKITIDEDKVLSVDEVFKLIMKQTDYKFFYEKGIFNDLPKVELKKGTIKVNRLLKISLAKGNLDVNVTDNNAIVIKDNKSEDVIEVQTLKVSGTVVDEKGIPLPGANIIEKGTTIGTQTDFDGNFSLEVSGPDAIIIVSYIGYQTQEIAAAGGAALNIILIEDAAALDEVVVVGYGTQSKRAVTGSVASVEVDQLETQPSTNVSQALRGRVAGVQFSDNGRPGQGGNILIRGERSITAGNNPLIVLDGAFYYGELSDINPADVKSMEVLKDASAAAIYGARAANGVILITSKTGKTEKPTIQFNSYVGVSDWSYKMPLYDAEGYLQRRLDFRAQNQPGDPTVPVRDLLETPEQEMYDAGRTIDPWDEISQSAMQKSYNLSVSGRTDKTNYFVSGGYTEEEGLIRGDNADRANLRLNITNEVVDGLKIGINSQFTKRDLSGVSASVLNAYWLTPYSKMYFDEGEQDPVPYPTGDNLVFNPMFNTIQRDNEEISYNLFANIFAEVDFGFLPGLSYKFNYNPNLIWYHNYNFSPTYEKNGLNNAGVASKYNQNRKLWQYENILKYEKTIGDHAFDVTLLYGRNSSYSEGTFAQGTGFVSDANGWNNLDIASSQVIESDASEQKGISSMARLNYQFKKRYLLTLTARRDGSSVFGKDHKFGTFPSMALGWIASDEPFMENSNTFDLLKFRLSYGEVGNQLDPYRSLSRSNSDQYVFGSNTATAIYPDTEFLANADLRWETTKSLNAAVDFSILDRRIDGTLEFYDMNTEDLILARNLPAPIGFSTTVANIGQTSNTGVELTLNTVNVRNDNFEWTSNITFSTNKNSIDHLYFSDVDGDGREDDDLGNRWFIGSPIGVTYDYVFDGIYQEGDDMPDGYQAGWVRVKDINGDNEITPADRTILGQTQPKNRWGFNNQFKYKNFSLSFFINAMTGWESQLNLLSVSTAFGTSFAGRSANFLDAGYWTPENQSTTRPGLTYTNPLGRGYYMSRDFIRLQDVTFSYSLPTSITDKMSLNSVKLYVSGRNLATITDWLGPDPESGYNSVGNLYPTASTLIGGINLSF